MLNTNNFTAQDLIDEIQLPKEDLAEINLSRVTLGKYKRSN